jgi:hypothetical protein
MDERSLVFTTAGVIASYFLIQVLGRRFDPFAPVWLFLVGYVQVYVVQALSYHEWAISAHGGEVVTAANFRALWALIWFLTVYHLGVGPRLAPLLPKPPRGWSCTLVTAISPVLVLWGLYCAGVTLRTSQGSESVSAEMSLLQSFPFVMVVAAILLIITARTSPLLHNVFLTSGLLVSFAYISIWMFNGKRSHSLIGVLSTVCAFYISRQRRPSWPILVATSFAGALVVALAIGWRNNATYERSFSGFTQYLAEFNPEKILQSLNIEDSEDDMAYKTYETEEIGGFLLMMDTVPEKSGYDYGANYLRTFSTMIPRILWPSKPLFGREQWIAAWIAGSELERDEDFTSPSIGLLGATQLNGGAVGTLVVVACVAILLRSTYEYFRLYADVPWAQFWWAIFFYNAWFMVVCDDPMVWFYYNWGFTTCPIVVFFWLATKFVSHPARQASADQSLGNVGSDVGGIGTAVTCT